MRKEVILMEGILLGIEVVSSPLSLIAGLVLLALASGAILLGYVSDEEKVGRDADWAEWPVPGVEAPPPVEEHRHAA